MSCVHRIASIYLQHNTIAYVCLRTFTDKAVNFHTTTIRVIMIQININCLYTNKKTSDTNPQSIVIMMCLYKEWQKSQIWIKDRMQLNVRDMSGLYPCISL